MYTQSSMYSPNRFEEKNPLSENEILHISKIPSKPKFLNNVAVHAKTMGMDMDYEPKKQWSEVRGELTHQYLKFVNAHLMERLQQINKMIQLKNEFEHQIEVLQSNDFTNLVMFPDFSLDELNQSEISELKKYMSIQRDMAESKINYFKNKIEKAEEEIEEKDWQLSELTKKFGYNQNSHETESDKIVKEELESLIKKYGMKELTYAVDVITSDKSKDHSRNS